MWFWAKYYLNVVFSSVFGLVLPWWFWAIAGLAASVALFFLLPSAVSAFGFSVKLDRLRGLIVALVFAAGACVSAGSWGIRHGTDLERTKWELLVEGEKRRLQQEADANLKREQDRAAAAEAATSELKGQLDALLNAPPPAVDGDPVVIDESFVDGLRNLGQPKARSRHR